MGCFISKNPIRQPPKPSDVPPRLPLRLPPPYYAGPSPSRPVSHPTPPTISLEEEAVKEVVLSETPPPLLPTPLPHPPAEENNSPPVAMRPQPLPSPPRPKLSPQVFGQPRTPRKLDAADTDILISKLEQAADVVSEYSDIYTLSGSLSVSTTPTAGTAATLNDSEVTSKVSRPVARTRPNRIPRKRPPVVGGDERPDRGAGSHVRKPLQPSPERGRRGAAPNGRDPGGVRRNSGQAWRDPRQRSSSPAQGRAGDGVRVGMGKIPSKRTGSSANRSSSSGPGTQNGSNPRLCKKRGTEIEDRRDRNDYVRGGNDNAVFESLDNPLVSLECFIFL